MVVVLSLILMLGAIGIAPLALKPESGTQGLAVRWLMAAGSIGAGAAAFWGSVPGADELTGALWIAGGAMAAAASPVKGGPLSWLGSVGWALGPLGAAALLNIAEPSSEQSAFVADPTQMALMVLCGVLVAGAAGLALRGISVASRAVSWGKALASPWTLAASVIGLCTTLRFLAYGSDGQSAGLRVADVENLPALWLTDLGEGISLVHTSSELTILLGAATLLAFVATWTGTARLRLGMAMASGIGFLGAGVWLISQSGIPVEPNMESAKVLLSTLNLDPALVQDPRLVGTAPFSVSARLSGIPLAAMLSAGFGLLGGVLARWKEDTEESADEWASIVDVLTARDFAQYAVVGLWLALAALLFYTRHSTGSWGPNSPAEHLMSAAALTSSAALLGLHGVGSRMGAIESVVRVLALGVIVFSIALVAVGGVVGGLGVFEL